MNGLDLLVIVLAVGATIGGYRLGFVARVTSWLGMIVGIGVGVAGLPSVIDRLDGRVSQADLVVVAAMVLVGSGLLGQLAGLVVGTRLHLVIPAGSARRLDAAVGAVAGLLGVAITLWLVVPVMADVPSWPAREARGSVLARGIDRYLPPAPDPSRTVRRLLGGRYPQVFDALRPTPEMGPPPPSSGLSRATAERVRRSIVLVAGEACGQIQEGSGFVVADGLVATNAHVVAGESTTVVETGDGVRHAGRLVAFDADRDIAIVRVRGLAAAPLPIASARAGDIGAVFGHPGGGPLRLAPYRVGEQIVATGADIYAAVGVKRDVLVLASSLRGGDSGAPLVSPAGSVVGVAFAIAPDRPGVAYALSTGELRAVLATAGRPTVAAGACLS